MRREHRPLSLVRARSAFDAFYAQRYLVPQFDAVGEGTEFTCPYYIHVFGSPITLGKYVHVAGIKDNHVRFSVWPVEPGLGRVSIGDYTVINPGVRIGAGHSIEIGRNAIFASNVYVTDTDWHGRYDRVFSPGGHAPVVIEDNVWLSERVIVGKGVRIGENSIIGAGSIVISDIPKNCIAAGNPARPVRDLDPNERFVSRSHAYAEPDKYMAQQRGFQELMTANNTLRSWLRYLWKPTRED
jgi:acetyltransferase-like isoleucine patch superfamily enzyme